MQHSLALGVAFLSLCFAAPTRPAEVRFAPAEGLALRKTFESRSTRSLDSNSLVVDGEEQEQGDQAQDTTTETRLVLVDRYASVAGDRVAKLVREYDEFSSETVTEASFGGTDHEFRGVATSELTGHTVSFAWDADAEEYAASSEDEGVEAEWLEELDFDRDFLAILPDGAVEPGDEWSVDPEAMRRVLRLEEDLPLEWTYTSDGEEQERPERSEDEEEPDEDVEGSLTARFEGTREVDGVEVAVILLSGDYEVTTRFSNTFDGDHGSQETTGESTLAVELEGELLWNLAGGHFHSCSLEGETEGTQSSESTMEFMDRTMSFEQESTSTGTLVFTARFASEG